MLLKMILFAALLVSASNAQNGWTLSHELAVSRLDQKDKQIFTSSLRSCELFRNRKITDWNLTPEETQVFLGTLGDAQYAVEKTLVRNFNEGSTVFRTTGGLGMYLYELLNSYGFIYAMKKCFDGNETKEQLYVAELLLIDSFVKGITMAATVVSIKYLAVRTVGRALIVTYLVAPMSGREPGEKELTVIQKMSAQLDEIKDYVLHLKQLEAKQR